ncbi:MAG: hypothetical protein HYY18_18460 [Planctomycetes bacterium]|nr:hypothetical protein [Planctomycetota bacterium]
MARLAGIAVLFLTLAAAAFAGEAVEKALADLDSDDFAKREAAERALMGSGAEGYEPCRRALEKATDEETKMRLGRVVEWLAIESKTEALEAAWRERWFLTTLDGEVVGWEYVTSERSTHKGRPAWKFASEVSLQEAPDAKSHWTTTWTSLHDPAMTPIRCTFEAARPHEKYALRFTFGTDEVDVELVKGRPQDRLDTGRKPGKFPFNRAGQGPLAFELNLTALVERASLARLSQASWEYYGFVTNPEAKCFTYAVAFAGEEEVEVGGRKFRARRYLHEAGSGRGREEYWIDDTRGVVRMTVEGFVITLSDEKTVGPMRPDAGAAARARFEAALEGIAGPADGRDEAEQRLLQLDGKALAKCREALAAASDEDVKARLGRVCAWLDPDFKLAELEAMWKDAWYVAKDDEGFWGGSEHVAARASRVRGRQGWKVESTVRLPEDPRIPKKFTIESRTLRDGLMTPADMKISFKERGRDFRIRLRLDPDWIEMTLLEIDGRKPVDDDARLELKEVALSEGRPWTNAQDVSRLLERASLARFPRLDLRVVEVLSRKGAGRFKVDAKSFRFAGEEEIDFGGAKTPVRKYAGVMENGKREEYWIEDARGLLKARINDMNILRTDKEGANRPPDDEKK